MATATSIIRIGPADNGRMMTLDEFRNAEVVEGYRYELARGIVEVSDVPNDRHGLIIWVILRFIAVYDLSHPGTIARAGGGSEFRLWLPVLVSGRNPDVAVALRSTPKDGRGRRPPSLAFEVVSEGSDARERDYVAKRAEYLAFGLREYWIVDPQDRTVTVLVRDGDAWVEQSYRTDQTAVSLVLPGLAMPLPDLWADRENELPDRDAPNGAP